MRLGEKIYPRTLKRREITIIMSILCAAIWLTIFLFFAPKYWAISIDPAIANQLPSEIVKKRIVPASVVDAIAHAPSFPTQKLSVNW